jgi:3-phenylpropionate/cinnamic acid dioxygenase small subunit
MPHPFEALVMREARLLDARDYPAWVALYTPDCHYWVPVSPAMTSPLEGPSHFNDDRQLLLARTHRLANPRAFAAEPPPRTVHVVSGVEVVSESAEAAEVVSSQIMLEWRQRDGFEADQRLFGGQVRHSLRKLDGEWRIAVKRIDLINAEGSMNAILAPF